MASFFYSVLAHVSILSIDVNATIDCRYSSAGKKILTKGTASHPEEIRQTNENTRVLTPSCYLSERHACIPTCNPVHASK